MAGVKVELLVLLVLTGTLLLGAVKGELFSEFSADPSPMAERRDDFWEDEDRSPSFQGEKFDVDDDEDDFEAVLRRHRLYFSKPVSKLTPFDQTKSLAGVTEGGFEMEFVDVMPKKPTGLQPKSRHPSPLMGNYGRDGGSAWRDLESWDGSYHWEVADMDEEMEDEPERMMASWTDEDQMRDAAMQLSDWTEESEDGEEGIFRSWHSAESWNSTGPTVVCSSTGFKITLPEGPPHEMKVKGSKRHVSIMNPPKSCGYKLNTLRNTLTVPFTGCNVKRTADKSKYGLEFSYVNKFGEAKLAVLSCKGSPKDQPKQSPRGPPRTSPPCYEPALTPELVLRGCNVPVAERVSCGNPGISATECQKLGGCMSPCYGCYYPLEVCTADQHFVFTIRHDSASIPVDPTKLVIPGTQCKPVIVNSQVAIFKFKLTDCGTRSYQVGETTVFMAEVQTLVKVHNLKFGRITRSDPFRFIVECRYGRGGFGHSSLATVGYMVKTPMSTMPATLTSNGLYGGVNLKVSKDQTFTSFLHSSSQPLRLLLGQPVFLELELYTPKKTEVILVNYCIAYPQSAKNALVLVYKGCANPYDPNVRILYITDIQQRQKRRLMVDAFQFMDQSTNQYLDEVINFMCSTEVCDQAQQRCAEQCFGTPGP